MLPDLLRRPAPTRCPAWRAALAALLLPAAVLAGGRPAGTGGLMQIEGAGGGGLTPWALIAGTGTDAEIGGAAYCTRLQPQRFALTGCGAALGLYDRLELSLAREHFGLGDTVPGQTIDLDVVGAKVRLLGSAVIDQDRWLPQLAAGVQWKHNRDFAIPRGLGARHASGVDVYLAATKLMLAGPLGRTWLASATLRRTQANQLGLLGFGGDRGGYQLCPEGSLLAFVTDALVVGAEYRAKPDHLSAFREDAFADAVASYLVTPHLTLTGAYARLGNLANHPGQRGYYASLQWSW